jgi:hypothetical protein
MNLVRSKKSAVTIGNFTEGQIFLVRENTYFARIKRVFTKRYYNDCIIVVPFMNQMFCYTLLFGRWYEKGNLKWLDSVEKTEVLADKAVTYKYMTFKKQWQNLQK